MAKQEKKERYLEVFDVSGHTQLGSVPLANVAHMPRKGERLFLPLRKPGEWAAYTVVSVEYFVSTIQEDGPGTVRVTLYVEKEIA